VNLRRDHFCEVCLVISFLILCRLNSFLNYLPLCVPRQTLRIKFYYFMWCYFFFRKKVPNFFQVFIMDDLALVSMKNAVKGET
jgi:hypothetical protein